MPENLIHIEEVCDTNPGGLINVWVTRPEFIASLPEAVKQVITSDITFSTEGWYLWKLAANSIKFRERQKTTKAGPSWSQELTGFIPLDREGVTDMLENMNGGRFLVVFQPPKTENKICGSLATPMHFSSDQVSGSKSGDAAGVSIKFTRKSPNRALYYTGIMTLA